MKGYLRTWVIEVAAMNERYLGLMLPKLNMLLKWEKNPEDASNTSQST
jgi:hypothetical protein